MSGVPCVRSHGICRLRLPFWAWATCGCEQGASVDELGPPQVSGSQDSALLCWTSGRQVHSSLLGARDWPLQPVPVKGHWGPHGYMGSIVGPERENAVG